MHGLHDLPHYITPGRRNVGSCHGQLICLHGIVRVLPNSRPQLFHRSGGLFECARLFFRSLAKVKIALGDLLTSGSHKFRTLPNTPDEIGEALLHDSELRHQTGSISRLQDNPDT